MTTEEKFNAAVNVIKNLPKDGPYQPSNEMMLRFYSYYKQATEGPCQQPKPAFWEVIKKAKWDAWKKLGSMSKEDAMNNYIEDLKKVTLQIVETMAFTDKVAEFMDNVGPFYEMVDLPLPTKKSEWSGNESGINLTNGDADNKLTDVLPDNSASNKPEWDAVEATIQATTNGSTDSAAAAVRDVHSDNFYSGSDSDEDEFSDPVDNDEIVDENTFEIPLAECNGRTEDNGYNESTNGCIANGDVRVDKDSGSSVPNGPQSLPLQNGMPDRAMMNGPIDGAVIRGGGDPMASRSTARTYGSVGHQQAFPHTKGYAGARPLGSSYSGGRYSAMGSGGGQGRQPSGGQKTENVNEQIALALIQLQHDMESVLTRLNTLEALTVAHHNMAQSRLVVHGDGHVSSEVEKSYRYSWWPFKNMSFKMVALFLAWPVLLHIIITIISAHRSRRLRRKLN